MFENLTLSLPAGGIYRINGPSGIGKTTLIRMLLGLEQPDRGSITGLPEAGRVSAVFQEDRLIEELSAEKNIRLVLNQLRKRTDTRTGTRGKDKASFRENERTGYRVSTGNKTENRVRDAETTGELIRYHLEEIGLVNISSSPVSELSGGMKRRLAIVRAMLHESELVIMDEPFTGLDEESIRLTGRYILNRLGARGLIFASHIEDKLLCASAINIDLDESIKKQKSICLASPRGRGVGEADGEG